MLKFPNLPCRWLLAGVCFMFYFIVCMIRVNLSLAIVAMVKNDQNQQGFDWDEQLQGFILSSFYCGYLVTQLPGGRLAEIIGAKKVMGWSLLLTSLLTLLIPVGASLHYSILIAVRGLQGLAEGPVFPAGRSLISKWVPPVERSRFTTFANAGCVLGTVLCMWTSGVIIYYVGWEAIFYLNGVLGVLMGLIWMLFVYDYPDHHPRISPKELEYIMYEIGKAQGVKKSLPVPMRKILTSVPVWTLVLCQAGKDWSYYCFSTQLPSYMQNHFDIQTNGFMSGLPYLLRVASSLGIAYVADNIREHDWLSELNTRKLFTVTSFAIPAVVLACVTRVSSDPYVTVAMLVLAIGVSGGCSSAYSVLHLVICPNFAGTTHGLATTFGCLSGLVAPAIVGYLTNGEKALEQWEKVFWIAAGIYLVTCVQFLILGTDEVQPWNNPEEEAPVVNKDNKQTRH